MAGHLIESKSAAQRNTSAEPFLDGEPPGRHEAGDVLPVQATRSGNPAGLQIGIYDGDSREWDSFVRGAHGWTHFHLLGWRRVIERVFGHRCVYLAARERDGRLGGVLPLVRLKSALFGHYLVSMPFVNYGGPLGESRVVRGLADHAVGLAQGRRADLLELRSRVELDVGLPVSRRKITVLLELPDSPEALWRCFRSKLRSQIRRPEKEGVHIRFGLDQVEPFFAVFSHHMRDLGTPTQPLRLFQTIAEEFPEDVWFGCAYLRDLPVAAGCGLRWGQEFEMSWASSLRKYNRLAPNMLLYWRFIQRAISTGVRIFNFGRCTPGGGTHRFKSQWGGADQPLPWHQHSTTGRASTPSPDEGLYRLGPAIWRRLPLRMANALGPHIVRSIP